MSTLKGVDSLTPLVLCYIDMILWINQMDILFKPILKKDWHSPFIHVMKGSMKGFY